MKPINMTKIWEKYKGLWVAMRDNHSRTVVGSGKTLKEALAEANKKGYKDPIVAHMPLKLYPMIGGIL
ncbi:MAG: DUF5678 domain-containing protein [Candidatus Taylorbacteria bacterium]|nr:DUF5678 domain-containing protein [Candidatus Taylorbacteria bacterium]